MSDLNPPENLPNPDGVEPTAPLPAPGAEETAPLSPSEPAPEGFAPAPEPATGKGTRRTALIALVAVLVAAVLGGGAFAAYKVFLAGGPRPAEALPASTIAFLAIDLDPSAGQKIEAIKSIRKFPALKDSLGLETQDDLRKFIFDKATDAADCSGLDFDADMKPWIGKRAAIAAVDLGEKNPTPALALQITDQKKAQAGFSKLAHCGDFGTDFAFAVGEDYLIASDTADHAKKILEDGQKHSLADDAAYKKWTDEAGDQGVVNFYVAKKASTYLADGLDQLGSSFAQGFNDSVGGGSGNRVAGSKTELGGPCGDDPLKAAKDQLQNFEGLAGTLRFADGGMELSVVTKGINQLASSGTVGSEIAKLPADSAIVVGIGVPEGYASTLFDSFKCGAGSSASDFITQAEQKTGLTFPQDLQTLLGSAVTLSLGGDAPADLHALDGPSGLPVGLVVHGDANKIKDLISKIERSLDFRLSDVPIEVKGSDSTLVLSPSSKYADQLLTDGGLGGSANFKDAVPNADKAAGIFYVNFDSAWRESLIKLAKDSGAPEDFLSKAEDNSAPLKSLGLSSWTDGGTSHILLKLATD